MHVVGGFAVNSIDDLNECIRLYDLNRPIGHIPRVELVEGDATKTIPAYVEENKHVVVAMLYLDFGVYEPTRVALEHFLPLMPKGSVLAFDELSQAASPGETQAALDTVGLRTLQIRRFPFATALSYARSTATRPIRPRAHRWRLGHRQRRQQGQGRAVVD